MKYRSMENRFCMSLVAFAVIVRLLLATGVSAALDSAVGLAPKLEAPDEPDVFLLEILEPETAPSEPPAQPEIAAASEAPAEQETEAEPVDPPLVFSADEADAIGIVGACSYQPDKQALLTRPSALSLSDDGPAVLIVHTHSSEAYTMEAGFEYQESDALRTLDERYSVIRVGDEIADILTEAGISVLHDTQPNDYPNYNGAYERMRQTIEGYLAEYPSIQMVLDIHRDAAEDADGNPVALTAEADGEACAELMLVVGTDEGGLSHPDWQENLANALKIQTLLNRSAPGLCRNLNLRTERRVPFLSRSAQVAIRWPKRCAPPAFWDRHSRSFFAGRCTMTRTDGHPGMGVHCKYPRYARRIPGVLYILGSAQWKKRK